VDEVGMVAWIRDNSNHGALVPSWGNVCCSPEGSRPLGMGCGIAAWIRDGSYQGAHASHGSSGKAN